MPLVGAIILQLATVPNSQPKSHLHVTCLAPFRDRSLQSTQPPPHQPLDNSACRLPAASPIYRKSKLLNSSLFLLSLNCKWKHLTCGEGRVGFVGMNGVSRWKCLAKWLAHRGTINPGSVSAFHLSTLFSPASASRSSHFRDPWAQLLRLRKDVAPSRIRISLCLHPLRGPHCRDKW